MFTLDDRENEEESNGKNDGEIAGESRGLGGYMHAKNLT